ncbi:MAG: hypothetical protein QXH43_09280 [Metallosphaera sp.]
MRKLTIDLHNGKVEKSKLISIIAETSGVLPLLKRGYERTKSRSQPP